MLAPREAFSVSSFAALREVSLVKGMTKTQGEIVLASFVASGWLIRSKCVVLIFSFMDTNYYGS